MDRTRIGRGAAETVGGIDSAGEPSTSLEPIELRETDLRAQNPLLEDYEVFVTLLEERKYVVAGRSPEDAQAQIHYLLEDRDYAYEVESSEVTELEAYLAE